MSRFPGVGRLICSSEGEVDSLRRRLWDEPLTGDALREEEGEEECEEEGEIEGGGRWVM